MANKDGYVEIPTVHAAWLSYLMETSDFKDFIKKYQSEHEKELFQHDNLADQLNKTIKQHFKPRKSVYITIEEG
jgi:hypothetical protein